MNIKKILIANRGEIALRIIKTCKKLGIKTVVIFSEADKRAFYLKEADEAYLIGESSPLDSYLNIDKIIDIAKLSKVDAIHPGYGFLSENSTFAKACNENNIIFIGPKTDVLEISASKISAKKLVESLNIKVLPGYTGDNQDIEVFIEHAEKIGYPVLIKSDLGGGGKGIKIVKTSDEIKDLFLSAKRESLNSFDNDKIFIEKYFENCKHIEIQIVADDFKNILNLGERECSIQRNYQKIIEESPSNLSEELRIKINEAAIKIAKGIDYTSAGTIEFIVDETNCFYFMEINPRLQVEHTVTEMITHLDIVELQIKVAENKELKIKQEDIKFEGHAIEVRICSENTDNNFHPSIGQILSYKFSEDKDIRIERGIDNKDQINVFYDSMLSKVICYADNRSQCVTKMIEALKDSYILGVNTNINLMLKILKDTDFMNANYNTSFINNKIDALQQEENLEYLFLIAALLNNWYQRSNQKKLFRSIPSGWRNNLYQYQTEFLFLKNIEYKLEYLFIENNLFEVIINNQSFETYKIEIINIDFDHVELIIDKKYFNFNFKSKEKEVFIHNSNLGTQKIEIINQFQKKTKKDIKGSYISPLPGEVVKINVKEGDIVKEGDPLITISSMKMENTIYANADAIVEELFVAEKSFIKSDILLIKTKETNLT